MVDLSNSALSRVFGGKRKKNGDEDIAADQEAVARRLDQIKKAKPLLRAAALEPGSHHPRQDRKAVFRQAKLFTSKAEYLPCKVINLSADGAGVELEKDYELPAMVTLTFEESHVSRKARIAWQHNNELGLAFIREEKSEEEEDSDPSLKSESDFFTDLPE